MGTARRLYINGVSLVSLSIMLGGGSVLLVTIIRRMGIGTGYNTDSDITISRDTAVHWITNLGYPSPIGAENRAQQSG